METLVVNLRTKSEAKTVKAILNALHTPFRDIEKLEETNLAVLMKEALKHDLLNANEKKYFLSSLRK